MSGSYQKKDMRSTSTSSNISYQPSDFMLGWRGSNEEAVVRGIAKSHGLPCISSSEECQALQLRVSALESRLSMANDKMVRFETDVLEMLSSISSEVRNLKEAMRVKQTVSELNSLPRLNLDRSERSGFCDVLENSIPVEDEWECPESRTPEMSTQAAIAGACSALEKMISEARSPPAPVSIRNLPYS